MFARNSQSCRRIKLASKNACHHPYAGIFLQVIHSTSAMNNMDCKSPEVFVNKDDNVL